MTDESLAARRHRYARAIRGMQSVDAAAQLLEAYERGLASPDPLPGCHTLTSLEQLPDHSYATLLAWALLPPPPSCLQNGKLCTMRADDLLDLRRHTLIGRLADAAEQAWLLGDATACRLMSGLCTMALQQLIGAAALSFVLESDDHENGEA